MDPKELLLGGDTVAALAALTDQVRANPADAGKRVALFQLLALDGSWERARKQLGVLDNLDMQMKLLVQAYAPLVTCELFRQDVFSGKRDAPVLGEPEAWMVNVLQALKADAAGRHEQAEEMRAEALEQAPALGGAVDGAEFEWIADADSRIGPFFEVLVRGHYYWVPQTRIQKLSFDAPEDVRDLIWSPVSIVWVGGGEEVGFIPSRYPGDVSSWSPLQKLSRETAWQALGGESYAGIGQRLLASSEADHAFLELRELTFSLHSSD